MRCLNDIEIQAVVDGEAGGDLRAHVDGCSRCSEQVGERRRDVAALTTLLTAGGGPSPRLEARVREAVVQGRPVRGATALRVVPRRPWRRVGWVSALVTAAVVALVVFQVLPKLGAPTTLSASAILGRSLKTLSSVAGVEMLEYELFVAGDMPGPHRIVQLIDHDLPGRFRFSNYGPNGVLESAIGQDSTTNRRVQLIRVDDRNYIVDLAASAGPKLSLPEMIQAVIETSITMMQATSDQTLTVLDTSAGRQYIIEMPPVTPATSAAIFDLSHARVVIDGRDFRLLEFEASGSVLKQPYSASFRLIRRTVRPAAAVPPEEFMIPAGPGDVVLSGESGVDPITDVLTVVLRELGRVKSSH
jgi:hypothetical protein